MGAATEAWAAARRVLCVRLDTLGDVLMTTPAIRALKQSAAGRRITLLTSPAGSEVASLVPEIDHVLVYESPWMKATPPRSGPAPDYRMIDQLHACQFDAAAIFTVFSQNPLPAAMLCYLAEIPLRLAHCRENPYQLLTDWIPETEPQQCIRHEVQRQLDLVARVGCTASDERMSLCVPHGAAEEASEILAAEGVRLDEPWIVVHPGATAASRRYPPESFAAAARGLVERGFQIALTGCASEAALIGEIRDATGLPTADLAGRLSLAQMAGLLSISPLLLSNNTGPVHMAAALGTPVVDLYALTNPQHTPWLAPHRVLSHDVPCKNCFKSVCPQGHHDCLRKIPPEAVIQATLELLDETRREAPKNLAAKDNLLVA